MKTIGMFFIVWGHLSPDILKNSIYTFSVPSFFVISGFLFKPVEWRVFWSKNTRSIILPYILLCLSVVLFFAAVNLYFGNLSFMYFPLSIFACVIGDQNGMMGGVGCQAMWFVYTLFLAKIEANVLKDRWNIQFALCILLLIGAVILRQLDLQLYSSIANLTVSYPFFIIGCYLRNKHKDEIMSLPRKIKTKAILPSILIILICSIICYFVGLENGMTEMYNAGYGENILLFLIGGISGTIMLVACSMLLDNIDVFSIVSLYSKGTIIILAYQIVFLFSIEQFLSRILGGLLYHDGITLAFSVVIYLAFIPIIKIVNKYFPILVGYRK